MSGPARPGPRPQAHVTFARFSVWAGPVRLLHDINLTVPAGQCLAVLGPSGSGKSTLLRAVCRLPAQDGAPWRTRGRLLLGGEDVYRPSVDLPGLRRRAGLVFQRPAPFPSSIFENVAYGLRRQGMRRRADLAPRVEQALRQVGLWAEVRHRLGESALRLSGGQQQRLCLARALVLEPEILLLDEPTAALDPAAAATIEDLLAGLRGQVTMLLVTHHPAQARRLGDEAAFLVQGRLVATGPPEQLLGRPAVPEVQAYLGHGAGNAPGFSAQSNGGR